MNKKFLFLIVGLLLFGGLLFFFSNHSSTNTNSLSPSLVPGVESKALSYQGVDLVDYSVPDLEQNTITTTANDMMIDVYPLIASDFDGIDITQYVNFTWKGNTSQGTNWVFAYDGNLSSGSIYVLQQKSKYGLVSKEKYFPSITVSGVQSYNNITGSGILCDFGLANNTQEFSVLFSNGIEHTYCFDTVTPINSTAFNINGWGKYLANDTISYEEWGDVSQNINYLGYDLLGQQLSYYKVSGYTFNPNELLQTKWVFTPKDHAKQGKWYILGYSDSDTITQAITNDRYVYLDPWWNNNWLYCKNLNFTSDNLNELVNVNLTGLTLASTDEVRIINQNCGNDGTEVLYDIVNSSVAGGWVDVVFIKNTTGANYSVYYNNNGASAPSHLGLFNFTSFEYGNGLQGFTTSGTPSQTSNTSFSGNKSMYIPATSYIVRPINTAPSYPINYSASFNFTSWPTGGGSAHIVYLTTGSEHTISINDNGGTPRWATLCSTWTYPTSPPLVLGEQYVATLEETSNTAFRAWITNSTGTYLIATRTGCGGAPTVMRHQGVNGAGMIIDYSTVSHNQWYSPASNITLGAQQTSGGVDNPPVVTLQTPANNTNYSTTSVTAYAVVSDDINLSNITFYLNNVPQSTNTSGFNNSNYSYTYSGLADGYYIWNVGGIDNSSQGTNGTQRVFTIDATEPVITANITSATQSVDNGQNVTVNFAVSETHKGVCWYQYNNVNTTVSCTNPQFNVTAVQPQETIIVYANDTFNNNATPVTLTFHYNTYGLMSEYHLEETTGATIDALGNNNGTVGAGITRGVTGYLQLAYNFSYASNSYVNFTESFPKRNNQTLGFWYNPYLQNSTGQLFDYHSSGFKGWTIDRSGGGIRLIHYDGSSSSVNCTIGAGNLTVGSWNYITYSWNVTGLQGYVNGVQKCGITGTLDKTQVASMYFGSEGTAPGLTASMDEIKYYNISLNSTEILSLYNTYNFPLITLNSPTEAEQIIPTTTVVFNWTSAATGGLQNTTLWLDGLLNETFSITGTTNTTTKSINLSVGSYSWFVESCSSDGICANSTTGTFSITNIITGAVTYNTHVYETERQDYNLLLNTSLTILSISGKLEYNGTNYTSESECSGYFCTVNNSIDVPLVTSESQNKSFKWYIIIYNGTSSSSIETSSYQQNISMIHLQECGGTYTTRTLNFTAARENNLTVVNPFSIAGTFNYWLGGGDVYRNYSISKSSTSNLSLCINPTNKNYFADAEIDYGFENVNISYLQRNYFLQNATLTNSTNNITLYLLESSDSTTFIQKVQDQKLAPVKAALIYTQRYYPGDDTFRTVQISKTSDSGETVGFYEVEIPDYKHIIIKDGEVLLNTNQEKVVGKEVPFTLTFTVGGPFSTPWNVFEKDPSITSSTTFNKTTNMASFSYIDTTGLTSSGRIIVYEMSNTNSTNRTLCDTTVSQPSATITCNLTGNDGTFLVVGYVGSEETDTLPIVITQIRTIFGREGIILSFFIILVAAFATIWNPVAGIIGIEVALIFVNMIGFMALSPVFIFASLAVAIITIILLKS